MEEAVKHAANFRKALEDGDAMALWRIWAHVMPNLPQPKTLVEATTIMHRARTEAESIPEDKRCYSHNWLVDHDYPSGLPDRLKPKADQMRPQVVAAVGVSVNFSKTITRFFPGLKDEVQGAMSDAVEELHADGVDLNDRATVHGLMFERREDTLKKLLGTSDVKRVK